MSIIEELNTMIEPPAYAAVLKQFPLGAVSKKIGLSYNYCSHILNGQKKPGKKSEAKFIELAEQVKKEMEQ